jgi:hypothetical protein
MHGHRLRLRLVTDDDIVSTPRFGDDAAFFFAEESARFGRDIECCLADGLRVDDERQHATVAWRDRMKERCGPLLLAAMMAHEHADAVVVPLRPPTP